MKIEGPIFEGCWLEGDPPAPYASWIDWMQSGTPFRDVYICRVDRKPPNVLDGYIRDLPGDYSNWGFDKIGSPALPAAKKSSSGWRWWSRWVPRYAVIGIATADVFFGAASQAFLCLLLLIVIELVNIAEALEAKP